MVIHADSPLKLLCTKPISFMLQIDLTVDSPVFYLDSVLVI